MDVAFQPYRLGNQLLANRFVFPPIKTGYGMPEGIVTDRQIAYYRRVAQNGPGILIPEPVAVTADGREHPKQLCVHLPESAAQLKKIVAVIHAEKRLACLHLNHAGAGQPVPLHLHPCRISPAGACCRCGRSPGHLYGR